MANNYYQEIRIGFVYDSTNGQEIAEAWPFHYVVLMSGDLVTYSAGFYPVPVGTVISDDGMIVASSMDEFNKKYSQLPPVDESRVPDTSGEQKEEQGTEKA